MRTEKQVIVLKRHRHGPSWLGIQVHRHSGERRPGQRNFHFVRNPTQTQIAEEHGNQQYKSPIFIPSFLMEVLYSSVLRY